MHGSPLQSIRPRRVELRKQAGNALIPALLALILTALVASAKYAQDEREIRGSVGFAEATTLKQLKYAADQLVDENLLQMKQGIAFTKLNTDSGVTTTIPAPVVGATGWPAGPAQANIYAFTIAQLRAMGYLPPGWAVNTSTVNSGNYVIRVYSTPAGCEATSAFGVNCNIQGYIVNDAPMLANETVGGVRPVDSQIVGRILTTLGTSAGVSLVTGPANITGFGESWQIPNPVGGTPAGVIAVRFEGASSPNFLRINDTRDPNFQANEVHMRNDVYVGQQIPASAPQGAASSHKFDVNATTTLRGTTTFLDDLMVKDAGGVVCAKIKAITGWAGFGCRDPDDVPGGAAGNGGGVRAPNVVADKTVLVASTPGAFGGVGTGLYGAANGANHYATMEVTGGGAQIRTSGSISADRVILRSGSGYAVGAACTDAGALAQGAGSALGSTVVLVCQSVGGSTVWMPLFDVAAENAACAPEGKTAAASTNETLVCVNGLWRGLSKMFPAAVAGNDCSTSGAGAIGYFFVGGWQTSLVCKSNPAGGGDMRWFRIQDITTNMVFVMSYEVSDGDSVAKPSCSVAAGQTATPLILLTPKVEASKQSTFVRYATDSGVAWTVALRDALGAPLTDKDDAGRATAIAATYCYYP